MNDYFIAGIRESYILMLKCNQHNFYFQCTATAKLSPKFFNESHLLAVNETGNFVTHYTREKQQLKILKIMI